MSFLASLAGLSTLLWVWNSGRRRPLQRSAVFVAFLSPTLLCLAVLYDAQGRAASLRFRLSAVRYLGMDESASQPGGLQLRVGGAEESDFAVPRLSDQFFELAASLEEGQAGNDRWLLQGRYLPQEGIIGGVVVQVAEDRSWRILGEVKLLPGDVISAAGGRIEVGAGGSLRVVGRLPGAKRTPVKLGNPLWFGWVRYQDAWSATYPIQSVLESAELDPSSKTLSSFIFFKKTAPFGLSAEPYLAWLDPSIKVIRGGSPLTFPGHFALGRFPRTAQSGKPANGIRLHFCGLGRAAAPPKAGGIIDYRSGSWMMHGKRAAIVTFRLDTPEEFSLTRKTLSELAANSAGRRHQAVDGQLHLSLVPEALPLKSIAFSILPSAFRTGGQALLVEEKHATIAWRTPSGGMRSQIGEGVWLGDRHQAFIEAVSVEPPWHLYAAVICIVLAVASLWFLSGSMNRKLMALAAGLVALLMIRFLFAFKAYNQYPHSQESLSLSFLLLGILPWAVLLIGRRAAGSPPLSRRQAAAHGLYGFALATVAIWTMGGGGFAAVVGILAGLAALTLIPGSSRLWPAAWLRRALERACSIWSGSQGGLLLCAACAGLGLCLLLIRVFLLQLGVRERISAPGALIAISIFYTPLLLGCYALMEMAWHRRLHRPFALYWISIGLFGFFGCVAVGWAVSDFGVPLLLSLPIAIDLLRVARSRFRRKRVGIWRTRLSRYALALPLGLYLACQVSLTLFAPMASLSPETTQSIRLSELNRNVLRLIQRGYPGLLSQIGRSDSDSLAIMEEILNNYTYTGLLGEGYFITAVTRQLGGTILREHVPAVFAASEFGQLSMLTLLILYAVPACLFYDAASISKCIRPGAFFGRLFGGLCFVCFSASSLYMILANCNLVLFTGKNAYLLGLDSFGDALESILLLGLGALFCLRMQRRP